MSIEGKCILVDENEYIAMIQAVSIFCVEQKWAAESWKSQPHIKPLFDIHKKLEISGQLIELNIK